jgi:hypothetical protein
VNNHLDFNKINYLQNVYNYIEEEWNLMLFEIYNYTENTDFENRQDEEALELQFQVEGMIYEHYTNKETVPTAAGNVVQHLVETKKIQLNSFDIGWL